MGTGSSPGSDRAGQLGQRCQDSERPLKASELGQVVASQPELARVTGVEQEHHHAASDAPHLAQAGDRVLPVMNGAHSHRGVEGLVIERQVLGRSGQARRRVREALRTHERRRFHREDVAVGRLVGPGARPDVQDGPGIAERSPDPRSDARFGAPGHGVGGSDGVVQLRARTWTPPFSSGTAAYTMPQNARRPTGRPLCLARHGGRDGAGHHWAGLYNGGCEHCVAEVVAVSDVLDEGPFFHGTKADLRVGDLLTAGFRSNYRPEVVMNHIYFTALRDGAGLAAELAAGEGAPRVYAVEPTGAFEDDPNVTDKKFPGNPTRSYRSREPLRVVGEVTDWTRLTPEALQALARPAGGDPRG